MYSGYLAACLVVSAGVVLVANAQAREAERRPGSPVRAPRSAAEQATVDALSSSETIGYPGAGAEMRAATLADQRAASVSRDEATAMFTSSALRSELHGEPRVVRLMRYSKKVSGQRNALAWVVIVPDAPVVVYNGAAAGKVHANCDFVFVMDAHDAKELGAFQSCGGRRLDPGS